MLLASITGSITSFVGNHGVEAVFVLMAIDAVFPAASELVMVYAGAVASGAFASQHVVLFGNTIESHGWAYMTMAMAGTPCSSIRIASSTLLELHDPQSPMPEMTGSHCARSALIASPSTSWEAERLRVRKVTVI